MKREEVGIIKMINNEELKESIKKLYDLIKNLPDNSDAAFEFVQFLKTFLRIRSQEPLPTIEVMTLIKEEKPTVFSVLRKLAHSNSTLNFLVELSTDPDSANEKLESILKSS